jgi:hypothetical protein
MIYSCERDRFGLTDMILGVVAVRNPRGNCENVENCVAGAAFIAFSQ